MPKRRTTLRIRKGGKRKRKHRSRRLRKRGGRVRRGQRGGACGCPKVIDPSPLPVPPYLPPGGMYKPGGINGLTGGYYYGVNISHALPDPASFTNLGGGYRKKRRRRKRKRKTRRRRRRRRRRTHKKRRRQKGGGVTSLLNALLPTDIMDLGYKTGHSLSNLYTGYRGEKPYSSPNVIKQPIDKNYKFVGTKPINIPLAYNKGQNIVNSTITPAAQRKYK